MSSITVFEASRKIDHVHLGQGRVTIGRNPSSRIHLDDDQVSWDHAVVEVAGPGYRITDLGSTNGMKVNDLPGKGWRLEDGDLISIGDFRLQFTKDQSATHYYSGSERTMAVRGLAGKMQNPQSVDEDILTRVRDQPPAKRWLDDLFPAIAWLKNYQKEFLQNDVQAGLTVGALLVPQGMAYALLAGLPPIYGLYASTLPLLFYALMGTSRQLSVGPVALDSLLVATGIGVLAQTGTDQYLHLAILLALMVGVIQLLMSVLRMGFVVNFLSQPVLTGFTAAVALIIAISQVRHLLGLQIDSPGGFFSSVKATIEALFQFDSWTTMVGIGGVVFLLVAKRRRLPVPGPIALLVLSTVLSRLLSLESRGVKVVGQVPEGLPSLRLTIPSLDEIQMLFPLAITLACIGFMSAISIGKTFASRYGYRVNADSELRALGLSNLGSHLAGGFPVTGSMSRSAVNAGAGARTQMSTIIAVVLVVLVLLFFTPLFYSVPIATLAAIIMTSVIGLINITEMHYLIKVKKVEGIVLLTTLLATLTFGVSTGLMAGIGSAMLLFIVVQTRPNASLLGKLPGTRTYRSLERHPEAEPIPGLAILRIDASFYFANAEFLRDTLAEITDSPKPPHTVLLDASAVNDLDSSGDTAFREIYRDLNRSEIDLFIAGVKGSPRDVLMRSGLYEEIGPQQFFYTVDAAVKRIVTQRKIKNIPIGEATNVR
ncbi:MAG: sodium-independent anion transporter [Thiothrix sp.]|nr:MAG: sodium-independent anion transporter [Thiothrix sp.]